MLGRTRADSSKRDEAMRLVTTIGPDFEALLTYVWRRHLMAAQASPTGLEGP
jgi:adenylate cyclase